MSVSPQEDDLKAALVALKQENPSLGIAKTHALLRATHPTWAVSEKRIRKLLQHEGLILRDAPPPYTPKDAVSSSWDVAVYPSSRVIDNLDVHKWSQKIKVEYFDKKKGKGLVATQEIQEGEVIWKEDPFILAPEWEIYDLQVSSAACGFCSTPLDPTSPLILSCPSSSPVSPQSLRVSSTICSFRFCNRLCFSRSAKHHRLLCPAANPASIPLIKFARETEWMALHALAQCTSRVLLAGNRDKGEEERTDWAVVAGLAEMGMEERWKYSYRLGTQSEPDRAAWKKAHALFIEAFKEPKNAADKRKLAKLVKKPVNPQLARALFDYEGFLRGLGRMSLNLEAHGGLYTLHSHLNHSCTPNVSVRHLEQRTALARITLLAKRTINPGEELLVTYVNPEMGVRERRRELEGWGFGECLCERCVEEERVLEGKGHGKEMEGLASELKAGLGLM